MKKVNIINMKYSQDMQDIINKDYLSLWNRYKPLQMVYYKKISEYIRHDLYEFGFEEFRQDCYIVLAKAANGVDIDKVTSPSTYSFYVQYSQWLHNFIKRDIVRDYTHRYAIRYMDYNESQDGESDFEWDSILATEDIHSNIWELVNSLPGKWRDKCIKAAWSMPRGGRGSNYWPEEVKRLFREEYTKY